MSSTDKHLSASIPFLEQILAREGKKASLDALRAGSRRIVVVSGEYDHVERILSVLGIPYDLQQPDGLNKRRDILDGTQALFVNCSGKDLTARGLSQIKTYVKDGGRLITTDWAIEHVVQKIFPDTIRRYGDIRTSDDVVCVEPVGKEGKMFIGLDYEGARPKWWLETCSYPIEILDSARVKPFITSFEFAQKYRCPPHIAVAFPHGKGAVMHFASHLVAQRHELRDQRDGGDTCEFSRLTRTVFVAEPPQGINVSGLETAYSSARTVFLSIVDDDQAAHDAAPSVMIRDFSYLLGVNALKCPTVQFNGCLESGAISALYNLRSHPVLIGRGPQNNIILGDDGVSYDHAEVFCKDAVGYIRDRGSRNGTHINGKKIAGLTPLETGDIAVFASSLLQFKKV